jgi:hypothetical protein
VTQSTNFECQIALTLAIIELEPATQQAPIFIEYNWRIDSSIPLWNNIQEVKYPQDSRSEPKQNY